MSGYTARALYGHDPTQIQPTASPEPMHRGAPEPSAATRPVPGKADAKLPIFALVAIVGLAVVLTQVSFRGEVSVRA